MKNFEKKVIDKILNCIKKNQEYLTQKENLPQLAKLGYMYNFLWYSGRVAYGYDGVLGDFGQCEDNPKYKIEMCDPINEKIDNLIYDAWGMHVRNEDGTSWDEFSTIVLKGQPLTHIEKKLMKENKTFDEWVNVLSHPDYEYVSIYPDRKSIANHLLCVIGNGYGYKNGFVIKEASGADEDEAQYGDWKNAKFRSDIQKMVNELMEIPEVKMAVDAHYKLISEFREKRDAEDLKRDMIAFGMPYKEFVKSNEYKKMYKIMGENKYSAYYPLCNYSIITKFDKNTHPSYIVAGIEICKEILEHKNEEPKENVKFAEKFLKKFMNYETV